MICRAGFGRSVGGLQVVFMHRTIRTRGNHGSFVETRVKRTRPLAGGRLSLQHYSLALRRGCAPCEWRAGGREDLASYSASFDCQNGQRGPDTTRPKLRAKYVSQSSEAMV